MQTPDAAAYIALYIIGAALLIASVCVVILRNLFRAALALGAALLGVAALFVWLGAEFLGFAQILVYVGAVLTLILFAVMLTSKLSDPTVPQNRRPLWPATGAASALFGLFWATIRALPWAASPPPGALAGPGPLGAQLVTTYALPFEMISLLLVTVMVGALVLAGREPR